MEHFYWHKWQFVILGPKIEGLSDVHPFKPQCLSKLSRLSVGNHVKEKQLLIQALELWRKQGNNLGVAQTLGSLSQTNWVAKLYAEGIQ